MNRILPIGHQQVRGFLRDRASYIWVLLMPLAFMYFMGFAVRIGTDGGRDPQPGIRLDNRDGGFLGALLAEQIASQGLSPVAPTNQDARVPTLTLTSNFTASVLALEPARLPYVPDADPGDQAALLTELRVFKAMVDFNAVLVEHALRKGTDASPSEEALRQLLAAPPAVELRSSFAGRRPIPSQYNLSVPGNLVMYLMMNLLIFGGASLAWERRSGVLRRLMVHPVHRFEVVTGKIYGLMILGFVQIAVLLLAGQVVFKVNIGQSLLPIFVTLTVYAWVAGSLGVWIGSLTVSEDKVVGLCILLSLVIAALGGCWWPLEIVPDSMKIVAHIVPSGWAMDALHQLISFGGGWEEIRRPLGVLALYGLAAHLAAARCFRY
jgi:ABC-type multidrug transport system permease subunit